jgi:hypothetical protein
MAIDLDGWKMTFHDEFSIEEEFVSQRPLSFACPTEHDTR